MTFIFTRGDVVLGIVLSALATIIVMIALWICVTVSNRKAKKEKK